MAARDMAESAFNTTRLWEIRDEIPTLRDCAYFNYGAHGPIPDSVLVAIFNGFADLHRWGPYSIEGNAWTFEQLESTRTALALALGVGAENLALGENISSLANAALWGLDWEPGDQIVVSDCENPTVEGAVRNIANRLRLGVTTWRGPRLAPSEALRELERCITSRTRLVVVSHVLWATGEIVPLPRIAELCRTVNTRSPVLIFADGAQSFGVLPDLEAKSVDFYAVTGHKWCCGPDGLAALYVREPLRMKPTFAGWRALDKQLRSREDIRKLETGTPCYALYPGMRAALGIHDTAGPAEARRDRIVTLRTYLLQALVDLAGRYPLRVVSETQGGLSGIVSFALESGDHRDLLYFLESRRILVRHLHDPECIRVCVHYLTTVPEIDTLANAIEEFLKRKGAR